MAAVGGHPLVARTLARRGITDPETARAFLDPDYYHPAPSVALPGAVAAAERLERAIRQKETICVWGDFDVDGQTATTTLLSTLRELGAAVAYHVPNRARESHGVNLTVLKRLIAEGIDLVLTCDTGVTAHRAIAYARSQGIDVIVTDHHDLPPTLPEAYAVINPKMLPADHPLRELPGVGVAYKLAELLYQRAGRVEEAAQYLDLAALGIVADVATQSGDARYLLQRGLQALRRTERVGLRALMESAELDPALLTEEHIGFVLAPRLNALGRLADASTGVELLTTDDLTRARILASELEKLNARRKLLCDQVFQGAQAQIERDPSLLDHPILVLNHPDWPAGVIGIVAGRLAEKYNRPTILISSPPGEPARGSARSVPSCDIHAAIAAQGDMLLRYGGHPMAAGLSIEPERIPEFRRALQRDPQGLLSAVQPPALEIDGYMPLSALSLDLVSEIERLAPFGPGNPPLTLASRGVTITGRAIIGRTREHLRLTVEDENGAAQVLWWRGAGEELPPGRFDLAYTVRASDYRGQRDVQVVWVDARSAPASKAPAPPPVTSTVVDWRAEPNPRRSLEQLREQGETQVWAEAAHRGQVAGRDRRELGRAETLLIWTAPPGPAELRDALKKVAPQQVYFVGIDPGLDSPDVFLSRLAGLVKRAVNSHRGKVNISTLAAATAQRAATVRVGLAWLAARGDIEILDRKGNEWQLAAGGEPERGALARLSAQLEGLLEETAAYRAHLAHAAQEALDATLGR